MAMRSSTVQLWTAAVALMAMPHAPLVSPRDEDYTPSTALRLASKRKGACRCRSCGQQIPDGRADRDCRGCRKAA